MPEHAWDAHPWSWDEPPHVVQKPRSILYPGGAARPAPFPPTWLTSVKFPCPKQPLLPLPKVMIIPLSAGAERSPVSGTREALQGTREALRGDTAKGWPWLPGHRTHSDSERAAGATKPSESFQRAAGASRELQPHVLQRLDKQTAVIRTLR